MARSAGVSIENNFSKGLITEVTGVNSPENSVVETKNIVYDRRGKARPREGFAYETLAAQNSINVAGARNEYLWETFSSGGSKTFTVVQLGNMLYFFEAGATTSLSGGLSPFSVNLLTYKSSNLSNDTVIRNPASFAVGKGYLFVTHPSCRTIYIKYDEVSDTIDVAAITIKIRDFEGVDDGLNIETRPSSLSARHRYNLLNQGWYANSRMYTGDPGNVLSKWDSLRNDFPAHRDVWWYYIRIDQDNGLEEFDPGMADTDSDKYGNSPAPKGHYILNALATNRTSSSGVTVPETTSNGQNPSVVAFFTGRVFYSGVQSTSFASTIYFTQIVESDDQFEKCYQANDPTSREAFDLLASDGGTIKIQDAANIIDLRVIGEAIFVFATNGVWSITGADNGPFKATDYVVTKVSSFPAISKSSIVDVGGIPVWWNYEGIFTLQKDQVGLSSEVTNMTLSTIQTFYDDIPSHGKFTARGEFNDQQSLVYWLYRVDENDEGYFDKLLVLDIGSGAFYPLDLPSSGPTIHGIIPVRSVVQDYDEQDVTASGGTVTDSFNETVTVDVFIGLRIGSKVFKFVTISGTDVSFSEISDETHLDWGTTAYEYYFITGYRIRGDLIKKFQTNYLSVITENITGSSCYVQGVWDYTNNHRSGRFTNPQQVYRSKTFREYQISRLQMRGNGKSLQFKFFGESGKPFTIIGWIGFETTDELP